ncbi:hypothetical protein R3W88_000366 [Solanum pinnatisectum]|uniref:Transmembrane protein n=1 Tax=Solanum pinnatisectum TaxID=50273 RepID=A0AAV9MI16_9SOLN|nr:hypothetical protein R3W88_000366 [Solanum pinnatisectum]
MLSSTFELFNQANSINSFVAFIFCNLIIVILLVNNNSSSKNSDNKIVPLSKSTFVKNNCSILDKNNGLTHTIETTTKSIKLVARDIDNNHDDDDERRDDEEEEDDELTRKVEEFIQKVNRCWKEEKLNA